MEGEATISGGTTMATQPMERRSADAKIIQMIEGIVATNRELAGKIDDHIVKIAKMEVTLDNQVKTIEKYNNFSQRLIHVESSVDFIKDNCANIQRGKAEKKKQYQVPWGSIISGVIIGIVVGITMYVVNHI